MGYVDEDGTIKKAICYQKDANALYILFNYEDIMDTFTNWITPTPSYYFNGKRWSSEMRKEYAHLEKSGTNKKDPGYTKKYNNNTNDKEGENWTRKNEEALDDIHGYSQNTRSGAGRGSIPQERQREAVYHSSDNRPRYRREDSPRRISRDHSRDQSRDRYRYRRYSDRSSSREKKR